MSGKPRIGVWVCECGGNIGGVVDVDQVVERFRGNVEGAFKETFLCSKPALERVREAMSEQGLERVILACCTPKMHRETFMRSLEEAGLNRAYLEVVNIREQCSWVHASDPAGATQKAVDLVRGAVERAKNSVPLEPLRMRVIPEVLVIGGGVAGITASLRLAEFGMKVHLVEKRPSIGGHMIQFPKVFPTLDCSQCILTPKMASVSKNPNINLITYAEVTEISGVPGDFTVRVTLKPRGVDPEKCTGCGECSPVCPVEVPNEYDENLGSRKAIYIPFPQSVPSAYTVDFDSCILCGKCLEVCAPDAIVLDDKPREMELRVGAIIIATGYELYDPMNLSQYGYGRYPNVVTGLEMERILDVNGPAMGQLIVPKTLRPIKSVGYILCAGSRDPENGKPYCSKVCCLYALKQAQMLRDRGVDVWIHYIDIRTPGRRYEEFYRATQERGAMFVKGKVAEVLPEGDQLLVRGEDMMLNMMVENLYDLVVLCPPLVTSEDTLRLAKELRVPIDEDGFILERHPKLDPLATRRDGIFAAGVATGPKDIQTTTSEAEGAAMKAVNFLSRERLIEPNKAVIDASICDGCGACVEVCPESAISLRGGAAHVNELLCSGCGACIPSCPRDAIDQQGLSESQLSAQIRGILESSEAEVKIIAFVEGEVAYTAVDLAGLARIGYPSSFRIIPLPSISRLKLGHILQAFAYGADGVMLLEAPEHEGPYGRAHAISEERAEMYRWELEDHGIDSVRLWFSRIYIPDWRKLEKVFKTFHSTIEGEGPLDPETRADLIKKLGST
jgi:heterodisulfide reductase subunit A